MNKASIIENIKFLESKPLVELLLDTPFTKELRIIFKKGQLMESHQAPFPIIVELFEGEISFGINDEKHLLSKGDILTLEANVPHDLLANADSIVRLSLSKGDKASRVKEVAKH